MDTWSPRAQIRSTSTSSLHSKEAKRQERRISGVSLTSCTSTSTPAGSSAIAARPILILAPRFGSSLYAALSQKVSSLEVLKITLGIGGDEIAHFLEWVDFAGNGVQPPVAPVSDQGLTFPNFFTRGPLFQPSLIFPVPCEFISADLPHCSVIRPSSDKFGGAVATIASFTSDGLFVGQTPKFFQVVNQLAEEADAATRQL
jgi:hypothetical protein